MPSTPPEDSTPLSDAQIGELQHALDALPAPLAPLDVSAIDGYLCGVLLQPQAVPVSRWLPYVFDGEGRALPAGTDVSHARALVQRRHAELAAAIAQRSWFDPWVYELEPDKHPDPEVQAERDPVSDAALPWVAGFALAMECFPTLMQRMAPATSTAPLALIYRHLDVDDLEDADELIEEIETLEPCEDLAEAVEGLVRATLLLADLAQGGAPAAVPHRPRGSGRPRSRR